MVAVVVVMPEQIACRNTMKQQKKDSHAPTAMHSYFLREKRQTCIMMSLPMLFWCRIESSGRNNMLVPSKGDLQYK